MERSGAGSAGTRAFEKGRPSHDAGDRGSTHRPVAIPAHVEWWRSRDSLRIVTAASVEVVPLEARSVIHSPQFGHFGDRKSTRLNSSHGYISYAVFCLKKKKH